MSRSALLIIDVQTALFTPEPQPWQAHEVLERIKQLGHAARAAQVPVVWVRHASEGSDLASGSAGWQLPPGLHAHAGDYQIDKQTPNAFLRTPLHKLLTTLHVEHLVVAGYASEFCVDTTVRQAAALGYHVTLAADAHTTHDKPHASGQTIAAHENATLPAITSFGVVIQAIATDVVHWHSGKYRTPEVPGTP